MALYLGNTEVKIMSNDVEYKLRLFSFNPITNGIRLITKDNYILKDSNGLFLTSVKESE